MLLKCRAYILMHVLLPKPGAGDLMPAATGRPSDIDRPPQIRKQKRRTNYRPRSIFLPLKMVALTYNFGLLVPSPPKKVTLMHWVRI